MKEQLIELETAQLAKEIGFDINVGWYYDNKIIHQSPLNHFNWNSENRKGTNPTYSAPTQTLLQKWLREEHGIFPYVEEDMGENDTINYRLIHIGIHVKGSKCIDYQHHSKEIDKTYEECLEKGLILSLELIKNK